MAIISRQQFQASSILPALFLLPLSLDFKGNDGGGFWQICLFLISVSAALAFLLFRKTPHSHGRSWQLTTCAVWIAVAGAAASSFLNNIPATSFARVVAPIILFALGYFIGAAMTHYGRGEVFLRLLRFGCATSVIFTVFTGFAVSGADVSTIRYQILSPVLLIYEALIMHQLLLERQKMLRGSVILLGCIALQLLSVTRSSILALILIAIAAAWIAAPTLKAFGRTTAKAIFAAGAAGAVALLIAQVISPAIVDRWIARLAVTHEHEIDPTSLARIAEMSEQLRLWAESPTSMLLGRGYGATYGWSQRYDIQLLETGAFSRESIDRNYFVVGHNFWVSSLFAGGILFGITLPGLLLWSAWRGMITSRMINRSHVGSYPSTRFMSLATLMLVAMLAMTIGGNPFGTRYAGLLVGGALGMYIASKRRLMHDFSMAKVHTPRFTA